MHRKRLMIHHIHELDGPAWPSRLTQPPLHRFAEPMHRKRLTMEDSQVRFGKTRVLLTFVDGLQVYDAVPPRP